MEEKRRAHEKELEARLQGWNEQFALLKARAEKAPVETKPEHLKTIEVLEHKQGEAWTKLHELKTAGDDAWDDLKSGAEGAWAEVATALESAIARLP